jgi:hypothetical protein
MVCGIHSPEGLGLNEQTESILFIRVPDCIGKYKNETFRNERHAIGSFCAWSGQHKISLYYAVSANTTEFLHISLGQN